MAGLHETFVRPWIPLPIRACREVETFEAVYGPNLIRVKVFVIFSVDPDPVDPCFSYFFPISSKNCVKYAYREIGVKKCSVLVVQGPIGPQKIGTY
jgi:hypothetical protein